MDTRFKATKPTDILMTMTITGPLSEWIEIRDQLKGAKDYWPCKGLAGSIQEMVNQAENNFVDFAKPGGAPRQEEGNHG